MYHFKNLTTIKTGEVLICALVKTSWNLSLSNKDSIFVLFINLVIIFSIKDQKTHQISSIQIAHNILGQVEIIIPNVSDDDQTINSFTWFILSVNQSTKAILNISILSK